MNTETGFEGNMTPSPYTGCPSMEGLPLEALEHVAVYFRTLSEPTRLQILNLLRRGERNVGELADACGYTSANISRHLAILMQAGLVARESRGTSAYYRIADESVYGLCDLVCGALARRVETANQQHAVFVRQANGAAKHSVTKRAGKKPAG